MDAIKAAALRAKEEMDKLEAERVQQLLAESAFKADQRDKKVWHYVPPVQTQAVKAQVQPEGGKFSQDQVNKKLKEIKKQFSKSV